MTSLDSIRLKLERADEHIRPLADEIDNFAFYFVMTVEDGGREHAYRVFKEMEVPRYWSLWIGDALHNMRCALDHLVYQLALTVQDPLPPAMESRLMFPIADSRSSFVDRKGYISGIPKEARKLIEELQPYQARKPESELLSLLNRLENIDKHRKLHVATVVIPSAEIILPNDTIASMSASFGGVVNDGDEYARIKFRQPHQNPYVTPEQFQPTRLICINEANANEVSAHELLRGMHEHLTHDVMPQFGKFFRP